MSVIIDRRLNDRNKSAVNRARFMRRYKAHLQRAVADMVSRRSIRDMEQGGTVHIPQRDIAEPTIRHGAGGDRETVHPRNREFNTGDRIRRPPGGGGQGNGSGEGGGDGEDAFTFTLSREEFMTLFLDDLELPNMVRNVVGTLRESRPQRAGYTPQGAPTNLAVARSLRQALGRRVALTGAARRRLAEIEAQGDAEARARSDPALADEIAALRRRIARVPFLDEIDLRYRHRVMVPRPLSQAVMFCLMDVSASMDERKKDLAKRFYTLLYLFLQRKYEHVDVVFIRHTDDAEEVDEEHFFHDPKTGGTVVYSALHLMEEVIADRYPPDQWNIYAAQASDGDAFGADPEKSRGFLVEKLLPKTRYFAYIEVGDEGSTRASSLSAAYRRIESPRFAMRGVQERGDIYPVFRELFGRQTA
ncbi:MAG: YeaH/YhbH family protein [Burkholderiaceae bacterium]